MPLTTYKGSEPKTIDKIYQVTFRNGIMYWSNIHHTREDAEHDAAEKLGYGYTEVEIRTYEAKLVEVQSGVQAMKKCIICGRQIAGYGNNPEPVKRWSDGLCCDECNREKVIPARLRLATGR